MRRISLALALVGAVAAAGCSGGAKSSSDAGGNKAVGDGFFAVKVTTVGGAVVLNPGAKACAAGQTCDFTFPLDTLVTVTGDAANTGALFGWAGDCTGWGECKLSGNADKYVLASFGDMADATGHPNWSNGTLHGQMYTTPPANFPACTQCHGAQLQGMGIAVSCGLCHANPSGTTAGDHFLATSPAFGDHRGWDQACQRCHMDEGFRDYIGILAAKATVATNDPALAAPEATASDNHLSGTFLSTNPNKGCTQAQIDSGTCNPNAYAFGPLKCQTCHSSTTTFALYQVNGIMFSNSTTAYVTADANTSICAQCHQGRESTRTVTAALAGTADDSQLPTATNKFINPHYLGAAATLFGSEAGNWFQYTGKTYATKFTHFAPGADSCTYCHDAHTGHAKVSTTSCGQCHFTEAGLPVANAEQLAESTTVGYEGDMDGNGSVQGLGVEFAGLEAKLLDAIAAYGAQGGKPICYSSSYPYFLNDIDVDDVTTAAVDESKDGVCTVATGGSYVSFTPRLMRAAFNLKWAHAEPGAWAHNPKYAFAVMFDTIEDLNAGLTTPVPFTGLREFVAPSVAHFDATSEAWTPHTAESPCYKCHTTAGFQNVTDGGNRPIVAGPLTCAACHADATVDSTNYAVRTVASVTFGSTAAVTIGAAQFERPADVLCSKCHSGRENGAKVDSNIGPKGPTDWTVSFTNPHYAGAAGILFGADAKAMYQYAGKEYHGKAVMFDSPHGSPHGASCVWCHNPITTQHEFEISDADMTPTTGKCGACHKTQTYGDFRLPPLKVNMERLTEQLRLTIIAYSQDPANRPLIPDPADPTAPGTPAVLGTDFNGVCYDGAAYPYWFQDNARACTATEIADPASPCFGTPAASVANDGICQAGEKATRDNGTKLNPAAAKAAFNYKWAAAEPGGFAHNYEYMAQAVIDSILDLDPAAVLPLDNKAETDTNAANDGARIERP